MWSVTVGDALLAYRAFREKEVEKMKFDLERTKLIMKSLGVDVSLDNNSKSSQKTNDKNDSAILTSAGFEIT